MLLKSPDHSRPRIVAIGMFDGVHEGHRSLLRSLVERARVERMTPAVVTFSGHPRHVVAPGKRVAMLMPLRRRIGLIEECGVDDVILLDFDERLMMLDARSFMRMLHDDYRVEGIVMGFNNRFGHDRPEGIDAYRRLGLEAGVKVWMEDEFKSPEATLVSSSTVRRLLADCDVARASRLLGRPYRLEGIVVHGKELGRTIGFPTANIEPVDADSIVPGNGVYAVIVNLPGGERRRGMLNIGHRPTVDNPYSPPSIEVNIFDFEGDIYGKPVAVDFIAFMRHERAFNSINELKSQLEADRKLLADESATAPHEEHANHNAEHEVGRKSGPVAL